MLTLPSVCLSFGIKCSIIVCSLQVNVLSKLLKDNAKGQTNTHEVALFAISQNNLLFALSQVKPNEMKRKCFVSLATDPISLKALSYNQYYFNSNTYWYP